MNGMPDREKISGFELCTNGKPCIGEKFMKCPFSPRNNNEQNCGVTMARFALALLKEQEPVKPKEIVNEHFPVGDFRRTNGWLCGKCGNSLEGDGNYCSYCGQAVKWE